MFKSACVSGRSPLSMLLRCGALAAALSVSLAAHADEYSDVNALLQAGQFSQALAKADAYLALKPRDPQMRFIRGVVQAEAGKTTDAIATFTKITQDYPELPEPYNNLAVLYAGQNQFDKARTALEMAIRTNPSYATAHENLGDVYAKLASQAYSKALKIDGGNNALPSKLALIRTLFNSEGKGQKQVAAATVSAPIPAPPKPATVTPAAAPAQAAPTTVAPVPVAPAALASASERTGEKEVEAAVNAWAKAWATKNMKAYFAAYGKDFDPAGKQSRNAWEEERRERILSKARISVNVSHLSVTVKSNKAVAKFKQDYNANGLKASSRKTLDMVKEGEHWLIVKESVGG